ncbi:MAG: hypothetical protein PHU04_03585 [Candidatus Peribacteraceae bacterium]|nr:hypothetical protein [Candidatus Peribacteraceae bacterium]
MKILSRDLNPLVVVNAIENALREHGGIEGLEYILILCSDVATRGAAEFTPAAQSSLRQVINGFTQQVRELMQRPDVPPFEVLFHKGCVSRICTN